MEVIEEASNMLLIQGDEGLVQKANNPRTRLKYGAGDLDAIPELFNSDSPEEFKYADRNVEIYPTKNDKIFLTIFKSSTETNILQNSVGLPKEYLESVENYLLSGDIQEFKNSVIENTSTLSTSSSVDVQEHTIRKSLLSSWFSDVPDFELTDEGLVISDEIFIDWNGKAKKLNTYPEQLITEFHPMVGFMYPPEITTQWNDVYTLTNSELYLIQRATRLYDKLVQLDNEETFDTIEVSSRSL